MIDGGDLVKSDEVCKMFNVSKATLKSFENAGLFDDINVVDGDINYSDDDIERLSMIISLKKIIEIDGLDYLNINASFRRCKYTWDGIECSSDKYLILTNEDQNYDYYLKLEGAAANLLPIPASEKISYQGQNLFLLQDGDTYQIYDGEKKEVSCKIDAQERPYHFISLIGPTSYFGSYTVQPSEDPETYKAGYKFVLNGKEKTVDYSDVTSIDLLGNGYSIILIKENGKNVSFIVYKDGSFQKKSGKEILWADKEYYMSYEDHTFSFYNMEDILIKKYIIA